MTDFARHVVFGAVSALLIMAGSAAAQENLDQGKTPAQLYASDCAICHKTPHGLSKGGGPFGLQGFLREHYTASREAAAAIAAYVDAVDRGAPAPAPKRAAKPKDKGKPGEAKAGKPSEAKGSEPTKPPEAKANGPAQAEPKPVEAKAEAGKPAAKPASEAKPGGNKPESEKKSD